MLLKLDFGDSEPIYRQIRNQIVMGIAGGGLAAGERLPSIRSLACEAGVNMMTVNKAYQLLKQEGYISTDRRIGAVVNGVRDADSAAAERASAGLKPLAAAARLDGLTHGQWLELCARAYDEYETEGGNSDAGQSV